MSNIPKRVQIFLRQSYGKSRLLTDVYYVCDIARYLRSEEYQQVIKPYVESDAMYFIWVRIYYETGGSVDAPIAHYLGGTQVTAITYRTLYDASTLPDR